MIKTVRAGAVLVAVAACAAGGTLVTTAGAVFDPARPAPSCTAATCTVDFYSLGYEVTYAVPAGVTSLQLTARGGQGAGYGAGSGLVGGHGATVQAAAAVTPGQTLYVEAGGDGRTPIRNGVGGNGFNGGGAGGLHGFGGGGATDVRTCARATAGCTMASGALLVAGGGGGAGTSSTLSGGEGGEGGRGDAPGLPGEFNAYTHAGRGGAPGQAGATGTGGARAGVGGAATAGGGGGGGGGDTDGDGGGGGAASLGGAGGGGGAGGQGTTAAGTGGDGGTTTTAATAGGANIGNSHGGDAGAVEQGGTGGEYGGGGGGGFYGGGGGGGGDLGSEGAGGGGGGSSYCSPSVTGCQINPQPSPTGTYPVELSYDNPIGTGSFGYDVDADSGANAVPMDASVPSGDDVTVTAGSTAPTRGTLAIAADGTMSYTPDRGASGIDTFTYKVTDPSGDYATETVGISIIPVAPPAPPVPAATASGDGQASVAFSAPSDDGGEAITSYTVTASPGGRTATGSGSPLVVDGLTPGQSYTFTVDATNNRGTSPESPASAPVTAHTRPAAAITAPSGGQAFTQGQAVATAFACTEGAGGPGLSACADQDGRAPGAVLDTATAGPHTLTVTATSRDGLTATTSVTYDVVRAPDAPPASGGPATPITTPAPVPGPAITPHAAAPVLTKVSLRPASFQVRRTRRHRTTGGTSLRFTLDTAATLSVRISRLPARGTTAPLAGVVKVAGRAGTNTITLTGKAGGRALAPGRYRLVVSAATAGGAPSRSYTFTVTVRRG